MKQVLFLVLLIVGYLGYSQNNCSSSLPICGTTSSTPTGIGSQELNESNQGCLTVEHNAVWYAITIQTSGTLQFTIDPNVNSNDFDFAVWGPGGSCPPTTPPIRCSYAIRVGNGNTGVGNAATDNSEGAGGDQWVAPINVTSGQTYYILVDNFSANSGFQLSFSGTSTLACTPLPIELLSFTAVNRGVENVLDWSTASETDNWYFLVERLQDVEFEAIDTVLGSGNSTEVVDYQYVDRSFSRDVIYYRLRQVDYSGDYSYSNIAVVQLVRADDVIEYYDLLGQRVTNLVPGLYFVIYKDRKGNTKSVIKKYID